jgi:hypothetical protein
VGYLWTLTVFASVPPIRYLCRRMPAPKRHPLQKLQTIVKNLSLGMTVAQAAASVGVNKDWFYDHTKPGSEHEYIRDKAEAAMIKARLRTIDKIGKDAHKAGDYKTALNAELWRLEKIYWRQYGRDERNAVGVQNNTFLITYEQAKEIERVRAEVSPQVDAMLGLTSGEGQ